MVCGSVYLLWFGIDQISLGWLVVVNALVQALVEALIDTLVQALATFEP
jgi:hypothetical protein